MKEQQRAKEREGARDGYVHRESAREDRAMTLFDVGT